MKLLSSSTYDIHSTSFFAANLKGTVQIWSRCKMDEVIYMRFSGFYAFLRMHVPPIIAYDREIARSHL